MTNLKHLIKKIVQDAEDEAKSYLKDAEAQRKAILEEKRNAAEEKVATMIERAKREATLIKDQTVSAANIHARDEVLRAKGEVIDRVINDVLDTLEALDDEAYIQFLTNRLKKETISDNAQLIVPEDKHHLVERLDLSIEVKTDETVQSGFMIKEGRITRNQTFASIIAYERDDLQLKIARQLFNE